MSRRLTRAVLTLALLFVVALGWLGRRLSANDFAALSDERERIVIADLSRFSGEITDFLERLGGVTARDLLAAPVDIESLRQLTLRHASVKRAFLLDRSERLEYPREGMELSEAEQDLLGLIAPLAQAQFFHAADPEVGSSRTAGPAKPFWWRSALWRDGLHLFLLVRTPSGEILGAECHRSRVLSELLALLREHDAALPFGGFAELLTDDGASLASWGDRPEKPAVLRELSLAPPLQSFRIAVALPPLSIGAGSVMFNVLAGTFLLGVSLLLIGVFAAREYRRTLREAGTRMNFVGKVSHELRTPLTNVRLYAEMLADEIPEESSTAVQYLSVIVRESERLSRLIGNVLRFGELDRGTLEIKRSRADAAETVRAVVELYTPAFANRGMTLQWAANESGVIRLIDRDALQQIVHNLLSNAEKYAGAVEVNVWLEGTGDTLTVDVIDKGPGIPESARERIFQPFFRISNSLTDGVAGTGIGLSIARELARLHGGDVFVVPSPAGLLVRVRLHAPLCQESEKGGA